MGWFRNLFKSHAQKRVEARREEEEAWRAAHREAGPAPAAPNVRPVSKEKQGADTDGAPPLDKAS